MHVSNIRHIPVCKTIFLSSGGARWLSQRRTDGARQNGKERTIGWPFITIFINVHHYFCSQNLEKYFQHVEGSVLALCISLVSVTPRDLKYH